MQNQLPQALLLSSILLISGCLGIVESDGAGDHSFVIQEEYIFINSDGNNSVKFLESSNSEQIVLAGELCIDVDKECEVNVSDIETFSSNFHENWFVAGGESKQMKISWFNHLSSDSLMKLTGIATSQEEILLSGWFYSNLYLDSNIIATGNYLKQSFILHFSIDGNIEYIDTEFPQNFEIQGIHFGNDDLLKMFGRWHSIGGTNNSSTPQSYASLYRMSSVGNWTELFSIESDERPRFSTFSYNKEYSWYTIFPCQNFGPCSTSLDGVGLDIPKYGETVIHILLKDELLVNLSLVTSSYSQGTFFHLFNDNQNGTGTLFGWIGPSSIVGGMELPFSTQAISHDEFATFSNPTVIADHLISDVIIIDGVMYYSSQITTNGIPVANQFVATVDDSKISVLEINGVDTVVINAIFYENDALFVSASICHQLSQRCELKKPLMQQPMPLLGNSAIIFKYSR